MQSTTASSPRPRLRGWSLRLGRVAGVDLYVHATFAALLAWLGISGLARGSTVAVVAASLAFVLGIFTCVVLHELGHALSARRYGIGTRDITLYPIGGVASLERFPENPRQELVIAIAGPLVNVLIAASLFVVLWASAGRGGLEPDAPGVAGLLPNLMWANLGLAVFNLLPAFPMDGGRALRALLSARMGRTRATRAAARIGQAMAVAFAIVGLFGPFTLLLIALFVWVAAEHEAREAEIDDVLRGLTVAAAMETRFFALHPSEPLSLARSLILAGSQVDVPLVLPDGTFAGLVGREEVARGLAELGEGEPVSTVARREVPSVRSDEPLRGALARLSLAPWRTAPVLDERRGLRGLLSSENVIELVMFREAAARPGAPAPDAASSRRVPAMGGGSLG